MEFVNLEKPAHPAQAIVAVHIHNAARQAHRMRVGWVVFILDTQQHMVKFVALAPITMEIVAVILIVAVAMNLQVMHM